MLRSIRLLLHFAAVTVIIAASMLLSSRSGWCRPVAIPNIQKMTLDSDLIAVVDVAGIRQVGTATFVDSQHRTIEGQRLAAVLRLEEILKGEGFGNSIEVEYDSNAQAYLNGGPITPNFVAGSHMIVFLQCRLKRCSVTYPEAAGFAVARRTAPVPEPPSPSVYLRVLQCIATGLFSDPASQLESKRPAGVAPAEIFVLDHERDPYVGTLFHAALKQPGVADDLELRGQLLAALVRRGDTSVLAELEQVLFGGDPRSNVNARLNMVLALQFIDWHLSLPIAARALQSPSAEVRTVAARSIQNLHIENYHPPPFEMTAPATRVLLPAVHDTDPEVAFAAMQSLGFLNARLDQRPTSTNPDAQWNACVQFWEHFSTGASEPGLRNDHL